MSEKTEKATAYKLQKAKKEGQVSKSIELNTTVHLIGLLLVTNALWPAELHQIKALLTQLLAFATQLPFQWDQLSKLYQFLLSNLVSLWLPFALTSFLCLSLASIAQTGFVWSTKPLIPNLRRLNLIQGVKRLFSSKTLFDTVKSCLKLCLSFSLILFTLPREINSLLLLLTQSPQSHPNLIMHLILKLVLQLLLLLLALAMLDKLYTNWKFKKDNRMTKQEVKDEYRQREGDPKIKLKIKQLQQQLRQKTASLNQIKTADVVITNPTHLAIALKYDRGSMPAPKVVFKARGEFANQAKTLAQRHKIPIIQNKAFAQALFASVELNHCLSSEHFPVAALIFREIYRQRGLAA
ncbi:EscU/YscU/HrcU family type III secretion system export apparatus switch protein [Legionella drozanskii]|uniref:Flagellar biosynthetic protein FlhB n=1 Tax=Legionella drozanskii LLAP-1 TaxID=1212489 RepID=A0A0W0SWV7_9GAMM|nr:EscU/YscU/HrcU family type III secretion system export apparatus switch protein [Legionella drozanskii]KTC87779.1 flagellar biosynthetic protein FlhB [Legionella drozanskii LLAP-1]